MRFADSWKIQNPKYLENEKQFFPIVKKSLIALWRLYYSKKIVFKRRQPLRSANNIKINQWKWVLKLKKSRICQVKHFFLLYWWMLIRDPVNDKTEIYGLSCSVWIFKCFKWDAFKTIFYMKNETVLELFNFYGTLHFILSN